MYGGCAAAVLRMRARPEGTRAATFVIAGGPVVPLLALVVSIGIGFGATEEQLLGGGIALAVGAALYGMQQLRIWN
jgi:hypothetical protein